MRQAIQNLEESQIREVANAGMGRDDVLAFWFGESDEVTPDFIRAGRHRIAAAGRDLLRAQPRPARAARGGGRATPARCTARWRASRIAITSGGVNALMLAVQALVDAGDEVVAVTPVWPNLTAQPLIMGAHGCARVAAAARRRLDAGPARAAGRGHARDQAADRQRAQQPHRLDAEPRRAAGHPGALPRAPAPGSWPTRSTSGCTTSPRANGCAPSFLDVAAPDDRLVVAHSFSKSFLMTGWRLGWLVMPAAHDARTWAS